MASCDWPTTIDALLAAYVAKCTECSCDGCASLSPTDRSTWCGDGTGLIAEVYAGAKALLASCGMTANPNYPDPGAPTGCMSLTYVQALTDWVTNMECADNHCEVTLTQADLTSDWDVDDSVVWFQDGAIAEGREFTVTWLDGALYCETTRPAVWTSATWGAQADASVPDTAQAWYRKGFARAVPVVVAECCDGSDQTTAYIIHDLYTFGIGAIWWGTWNAATEALAIARANAKAAAWRQVSFRPYVVKKIGVAIMGLFKHNTMPTVPGAGWPEPSDEEWEDYTAYQAAGYTAAYKTGPTGMRFSLSPCPSFCTPEKVYGGRWDCSAHKIRWGITSRCASGYRIYLSSVGDCSECTPTAELSEVENLVTPCTETEYDLGYTPPGLGEPGGSRYWCGRVDTVLIRPNGREVTARGDRFCFEVGCCDLVPAATGTPLSGDIYVADCAHVGVYVAMQYQYSERVTFEFSGRGHTGEVSSGYFWPLLRYTVSPLTFDRAGGWNPLYGYFTLPAYSAEDWELYVIFQNTCGGETTYGPVTIHCSMPNPWDGECCRYDFGSGTPFTGYSLPLATGAGVGPESTVCYGTPHSRWRIKCRYDAYGGYPEYTTTLMEGVCAPGIGGTWTGYPSSIWVPPGSGGQPANVYSCAR